MNILAIDTTGLAASVALVNENKTIGEYAINFKKTHSETTMPMISALLKITDFKTEDIDFLACTSGPGSFTGLRIGAATAKGLAYGLNKKIVPVPTLDAIAYNIFETSKLIVPIMDARRNQVYSALYEWGNTGFKRISEYFAEDIGFIIREIGKFNREAVFLGDGVGVHFDLLKQHREFSFADSHLNVQRAAAVGALAIKNIDMAVVSSEFKPFYLRLSQAEREFKENNVVKNV